MGPDELFQSAVIARRYYLEGRTRVEIAEEFGISRFKVARVLDEALASGMVEITIHSPGAIDVEISTELQRKFGLEHAYAVEADTTDPHERVAAVAKAMAELLESILRDGDVLGVDIGRTLTHVADHLTALPRCDVVQLSGMAGAITSNGTDLVRRLSQISGGRSWPLYAPIVVSDPRTATSLSSGRQIKETVDRYQSVTCAIVSVGAWKPGASQVFECLTRTESASLAKAGVVGETCALLVDANGNRIGGLDQRRIGVDEATLRAIPTVIVLATGPEKVDATRAVLLSGLASSLVTDTTTACAVL